jgi:serine/threonine protein kinase
MQTACGTTEWMAPEVINAVMERVNLLNFLSNHHSRYSSKIDIWAVGSIFYTLCCGKPPFYSENITTTIGNIITGKYSFYSPAWDSMSKDAKSVIAKMLQLDPSKRPTASECLECEWLRNEKVMSDEDNFGAAKTLQDYNRARKKTKVCWIPPSIRSTT